MNINRSKIGVIALFFDLYLTGGEKLLNTCRAFAAELVDSFEQTVEVIFPGVCINRVDVDSAVTQFEAANVDIIVIIHLTYTPSMYALPALLKTTIPILLFCTQKLPAVTDAITSWDLEENHGVHGFQDLANVLRRAGKEYSVLVGYWKEPTCRKELEGWLQAARIRQILHKTHIGLIGHSMENMGDFGVDETALEAQLGVHVRHLSMHSIAKTAQNAPQCEIQAQMDFDNEHFQAQEMVTRAQHEAAARLEWALRDTLKRDSLLGFASHFLSIGDEGWLETLPFLAASKLLAEGYSFGGEGDVTSAAAVSIMHLLAGEANFTEIFTVDFEGDAVLMSHMGEGNWKMAREDFPIQMRSDPFDMIPLQVNPVSLVFSLRPGPATLLNITTGPQGRIQWIVTEGQVTDAPPLPNLTQVHNRFKSHLPVKEFIAQYSMLGGSHHLALAYGSWKGELSKLARLLSIQYVEI